MESFPHTKFTISTSYSLWLQVLMCVFSICSKVSVNAPPSLCPEPGREREAHSRNPPYSYHSAQARNILKEQLSETHFTDS